MINTTLRVLAKAFGVFNSPDSPSALISLFAIDVGFRFQNRRHMSADPSPLLEVSALQKAYNVPVLVDFDFELQRGEVHALIGSNGAGKSTFARILCGLTHAEGGQIGFEGHPYDARSKREAEHSGVLMVLQELNVIGTLSVAENIFLGRLPRCAGFVRFGELQARAREALARVGLGGLDPVDGVFRKQPRAREDSAGQRRFRSQA